MVNRTWQERNKIIRKASVDGPSFEIDQKDFETLMNLYHFLPDKATKSFFDKKRMKTVAYVVIDKFNILGPRILFSQDWVLNEALRTNSNFLVNLLKKNDECFLTYNKYREKRKEIETFDKLNIKNWDLLGDIEDEMDGTVA